MNTFQPDLIAELNLHGWDLTPDPLTAALYYNKRHLFLRSTRPTTGSQLGSRIRLFVDTHTPSHGISIPSVRSVTVSTERKSIARWVSLAVMETAEAAEQVRSEKAQPEKLKADRLDALGAMVSILRARGAAPAAPAFAALEAPTSGISVDFSPPAVEFDALNSALPPVAAAEAASTVASGVKRRRAK